MQFGIREILFVGSEIIVFGIRYSAQGIRNPTNDCNPESRTLSPIHGVESRMQDCLGALTICTEISVKNFRQMVLVFFWHREQERD